MAALGDVFDRHCLALPHVPIEADGNRGGGKWSFMRAGGNAGDNVCEFSDSSVADEFAGEPETFIAALLAAGLENAFGFVDGVYEVAAFVNGEGQRFFAVDIFAGVDGGNVDEGVPVVGCGVDDDVNVVALENFAGNLCRGWRSDIAFVRRCRWESSRSQIITISP